MIEWYKSKNLSIFFSNAPHVCVRYVTPSMTDKEKKSIKKYPFICKTELEVAIFDHTKGKKYKFTIHKGYCWNGSDIPRIFWRIIGSKSEPQYLIASCLHDWMLEHKQTIDYNRRLSTEVFKGCLLEAGVGKVKASIMAEAVDLFQLFCDWGLEWDK
jgi:hypothetical protein